MVLAITFMFLAKYKRMELLRLVTKNKNKKQVIWAQNRQSDCTQQSSISGETSQILKAVRQDEGMN